MGDYTMKWYRSSKLTDLRAYIDSHDLLGGTYSIYYERANEPYAHDYLSEEEFQSQFKPFFIAEQELKNV